jgi:hypothetical protein
MTRSVPTQKKGCRPVGDSREFLSLEGLPECYGILVKIQDLFAQYKIVAG